MDEVERSARIDRGLKLGSRFGSNGFAQGSTDPSVLHATTVGRFQAVL
jgi:hypothetical protein